MLSDLDFFSTSPQVPPVLMLTIVFELRQWNSATGWDLFLFSVALLALVGGEAAALPRPKHRYTDRPTRTIRHDRMFAGAGRDRRFRRQARINAVAWLRNTWACALVWILWLVAVRAVLRYAAAI